MKFRMPDCRKTNAAGIFPVQNIHQPQKRQCFFIIGQQENNVQVRGDCLTRPGAGWQKSKPYVMFKTEKGGGDGAVLKCAASRPQTDDMG
ncbi:hypothetical protein LJB86_05210 [Deltaproteobacteria bacterium OttesenSCG-928-M10]|nr:hypothetical protein [Deltaproteobacteria bacterium OttesenSCG-928-M10]